MNHVVDEVTKKKCCFDGCNQPAVDTIRFASDENLNEIPVCPAHLGATVSANQKYERRVSDFVRARAEIPVQDGFCIHENAATHAEDLAKIRDLTIQYRRELLLEVLREVPICRHGKILWLDKRSCAPEELRMTANAQGAFLQFFQLEIERKLFYFALRKPFFLTDRTTTEQAEESMRQMIAKRLADFPAMSPAEHAEEVLRLYYEMAPPVLRPKILAAYKDEFSQWRPN
jgi:hypothetical protein